MSILSTSLRLIVILVISIAASWQITFIEDDINSDTAHILD